MLNKAAASMFHQASHCISNDQGHVELPAKGERLTIIFMTTYSFSRGYSILIVIISVVLWNRDKMSNLSRNDFKTSHPTLEPT